MKVKFFMRKLFITVFVLSFSTLVLANEFNYRLGCMAAMFDMPNGTGSTVYYIDGSLLTSSAGTSGASWYYPNGKLLTSNISNPGASYYYPNGKIFSSNTGKEGASWYYPDGRVITSSGPELSPIEMAELACDLIYYSEY